MSAYDPRYDSFDGYAETRQALQDAEDRDDAQRAAFLAMSEDAQEEYLERELAAFRFTAPIAAVYAWRAAQFQEAA